MRVGVLKAVALFLCFWSLFAAEIHVTPEAADAYRKGRQLQEGGNLKGAEIQFQEALRHSSGFPHALSALADVWLDMGKTERAEEGYKHTLAQFPAWISAANSLGFLYMNHGRMGDAVKVLESAVTAAPDSMTTRLNLGVMQKQLGDHARAIETFKGALLLDPSEAKAAYNLANTFYGLGKLSEAVESYRHATRINPAHADSYNNMANALRDMGDKTGARAALEAAIRIDENNVAALVNLGNKYSDDGEHDAALQVLNKAFALEPDLPEVVCTRANCLHALGRSAEAIAAYARVVAQYPNAPQYRKGLADVLASVAGREEEALAEYEVVLRQEGEGGGEGGGGAATLSAMGGVLKKLRRNAHSIARYHQAVTASNGTDAVALMNLGVVEADEEHFQAALLHLETAAALAPAHTLALSNLGTVLHKTGQYAESVRRYREALAVEPNAASLRYNLANSLMDLAIQSDYSLLDAAISEYSACLRSDAVYPGALNNLGNALKELDRFRPALRAWVAAQRVAGGENPDVFANLVHLRMFICDWDGWDRRHARLVSMLESQLLNVSGSATVSCQPFHALLYRPLPPSLPLRVAQNFAAATVHTVRHYAPPPPPPPPPPDAPLRVAYVSHDFGDHPTGQLFSGVPPLHEQGSRVQAWFFSLAKGDGSRYWRRLAAVIPAHRLVDVSTMAVEEAAAAINSAQVQVLVDLDGWMKGRRPEILALRPARHQVLFLGFPGSSGAPYMDHIATDRIVSPPELYHLYAERLLLLPGPYQVNEYRDGYPEVAADIRGGAVGTRREDWGLPEGAVLLANFNQLYKLDPRLLALWARVVQRCGRRGRDVRLWLLRFPRMAAGRVQREAEGRGLSAERVVWSERVSKEAHLRRAGLGDLFVDNLHVNGHTTGTEALWAGVPVLTCAGEGMASRVGASLVDAAGVGPEMTVRTEEEYEELAVRLVGSQKQLRRLRRRLEEGRGTSRLFDTERWVRNWEVALRMMAEEAVMREQGQRAAHMVVRES